MNYIEQIKNYKPKNEQEKMDQKQILAFIKNNDDHLYRSNLTAHLTSSAIICNPTLTKTLFVYHNIYDSWGWVGGHLDGNPNLLEVAIKEAKEENGIKKVVPFDSHILLIDSILVKNHIKHDKYVPDHLHLNVTFLLIADENQKLMHKPDENQGVKWFDLYDIFNVISENRMIPIYQKALHEINKIALKN